ncbi:TPA: hypothetical protein ACXZVG_004863, partial [Salmonella enterica]
KKSINNLNAITATTTTPINVSITLTPVINIEHNISWAHRENTLSAVLHVSGQKAGLSLPETPRSAPDDFYAPA